MVGLSSAPVVSINASLHLVTVPRREWWMEKRHLLVQALCGISPRAERDACGRTWKLDNSTVDVRTRTAAAGSSL